MAHKQRQVLVSSPEEALANLNARLKLAAADKPTPEPARDALEAARQVGRKYKPGGLYDDLAVEIARAALAAPGDAETVYAAAMLTAWRKTKDFLRDRILTSGRSDVNINAVLRVMNEALNEPPVALAAPGDEALRSVDTALGKLTLDLWNESKDTAMPVIRRIDALRAGLRSPAAAPVREDEG